MKRNILVICLSLIGVVACACVLAACKSMQPAPTPSYYGTYYAGQADKPDTAKIVIDENGFYGVQAAFTRIHMPIEFLHCRTALVSGLPKTVSFCILRKVTFAWAVSPSGTGVLRHRLV